MEHDRKRMLRDIQPMQTLPTTMASSAATGDELVADTDEPPDEKLGTPRPRSRHQRDSRHEGFGKSTLPSTERKQSLLTQALHTSDSENPTEGDLGAIRHIPREMSTVSIQSNTSAGSMAELTSDGGFTSPGTRNSSPSPPLPPASFRGLPPIFNKPGFEHPVTIRAEDDHIGPFQKPPTANSSEGTVEAGLGRKRCISFACGRSNTPTPAVAKPPKAAESQATEVKRPCTIRFACPNKVSIEKPTRSTKPPLTRQRSPAPKLLKAANSPTAASRSHRDSDSTLRNPSPLARRKLSLSLRTRRDSDNSDIGRSEATRFHEFASSEEEIDEWVQESTCHRQRLTVSDTLKIENRLRRLGEEAEEEAIEEENDDDDEEEDEDEDEIDDEVDEDGDDDDDVDVDNVEEFSRGVDSTLYEDESSDDGFKTDDEEGFAGSDDDSDAGSDYAWWSPQRQDGATPAAQTELIRPRTRRSFSESSVGSPGGSSSIRRQRLPPTGEKRLRKPKPLNIRPRSPELPDSTDFVCGTLDEDRPLEQAYMSALEARRIAKHRFTPQDIDPTFPTSDPEMDEEDEDEDERPNEESDQHVMMVGSLEATDGEFRGRHQRPKGRRSPPLSARRMKSPPPRRLFDSPPKRLRSPPPARRLRSPPPTRRQSFALSPKPAKDGYFISLAQRPQLTMATSLPRTPLVEHLQDISDDDEETSKENAPSRSAIEIKAGLECKKRRRQEKLYQKHCRKEAQREKDKRFRPGIGCEKMRQIGLEAISRKRQEIPFPPTKEAMILSF